MTMATEKDNTTADIFEKDLSGAMVSPLEPGYDRLIGAIFDTMKTAYELNEGYHTPDEVRSYLSRITGREIDRHFCKRHGESAVREGRGYAVYGFFYGRVGKAHDESFWFAPLPGIYLYLYRQRLDSDECARIYPCQHLSKKFTR